MGSLPLEDTQVSRSPKGNILTFFRTCSKPDLDCFIDATSAHFLEMIKEPRHNKQVPFYPPENLVVNTTLRDVPLVQSSASDEAHADVLTVVTTFISEFLALALRDDLNEGPKQSRIRCKIATIVAAEGVYERLRTALDDDPKRTLEESFARDHLKRQQWLAGKQGGLETGGHKTENFWTSWNQAVDETGQIQLESEIVSRPAIIQVHSTSEARDEVTVVVPAAGRSSRFPGHKPKWLLTQPNGCLMIVDALGALDLTNVGRIVMGILRDHLDRFCGGDAQALLMAFEDGQPRLREIPISIVIIPQDTIDQVQTIECILKAAQVTGPIFLKDCDNQFACPMKVVDGVATLEISHSMQSISIPASKSYVSLTPARLITNIAEKVILSNTFCIGGYSFRSASETMDSIASARRYQKLSSTSSVELSVSDVVWLKMIVGHAPFVSIPATAYEDWGTLDAWTAYTRSWKTLFLDIDGTLLVNTGQYFRPNWSQDSGTILPETVKHLQFLRAHGRTQIILTTTRPERFRDLTERQLKEGGVPFDRICYGLLHCQRVLVNDWAKTNPFPSAVAVNLPRNGDGLKEMLTY